MTVQLAQTALNLLIAAYLGAAIGLERQWRQRLAGLRTNTLVALGAAIFVTYSHVVPDGAGDTRMAAQVISGIGFLGAGVIFKEGLKCGASTPPRPSGARRRSASWPAKGCALRSHGRHVRARGQHRAKADCPRH